ncbi:MAG: GpE family phage tail protein [Gammaproteobacteria bacterium]|nr:MAG: GpE family phage tail protein [Gammaproteobacteria bacterium]
MAMIARTYHFQPSEIDELELPEFIEWLKRC